MRSPSILGRGWDLEPEGDQVSQLFAALCLPQPVGSAPHNSPLGVKGTEAGHQDLEGAHKGLWGKHEIGFPSDCEGKNSPYCENK